MSSSQSPAAVEPALTLPNFGRIVSSQLIGSLLNFFFFGMLLVQVYVYRICFPKDSLAVKLLVYFIFLTMTVCTCLNAADVQFWFGAGFGDIARFADPGYSRFYTPLMGSFIAMLVQLFYCYRITVIRRTAWPLSVVIALISMAQCAGGMGGGIITFIAANDAHDRPRTILVYIWLVGGAVADVVIAAAMTALLVNASSIPATRDAVRNIVRLTIETNAFSAIVAIVGLALFVGIPNTTYFICPTMILPGIYANTLLVTLNNRAITRMSASSSTAINFAASMEGGSVTKAPRFSASTTASAPAVPARSFERQTVASEKTEVAGPQRNSTEGKWRAEPGPGPESDSGSGYASEVEVETRV
ncbi:hypothetical protein FB451DRAFT_1411205 [Mycena latifolia]|nr:hypothetical protein FB451DRAFT_1411205 [Mycena latifolia]